MNGFIATLGTIGAFLAANPELIEILKDAIDGGTPKDVLMDAIRAAQLQASKEKIRAELGIGRGVP
ncbi:hypothetical protein AKJ09_11510 [Labilithrix luteola]|uniref:Uncharacterized protein n=1 Tax=Labilithrix luteola TaxID=1391654 RepID=A0A0K1PJS8_9BACT|nr:hypothetical protein [Labilithrix luteola]AKU93364.1 hypothetical protein AKJ09_00028 [Labilithrix luteola]AKV04847.1 hypothetical protein AKJ09_11510 [Labilithrix luteola]